MEVIVCIQFYHGLHYFHKNSTKKMLPMLKLYHGNNLLDNIHVQIKIYHNIIYIAKEGGRVRICNITYLAQASIITYLTYVVQSSKYSSN